MEQYGFIYIWYDRKHKRFYIGSHWGTEDDGYVCSSTWMKNSYKRRTHDFKRRILQYVYSRDNILEEEHRWLSLITNEELGKRYYNLTKHKPGHWHVNPKSRLSVGEKISKKNKGFKNSLERNKKISDSSLGKVLSEETKQKLSKAHMGKVLSEETKQKLSTTNKNKILSDETRKRMSEARKGKSWSPLRFANNPKTYKNKIDGIDPI